MHKGWYRAHLWNHCTPAGRREEERGERREERGERREERGRTKNRNKKTLFQGRRNFNILIFLMDYLNFHKNYHEKICRYCQKYKLGLKKK